MQRFWVNRPHGWEYIQLFVGDKKPKYHCQTGVCYGDEELRLDAANFPNIEDGSGLMEVELILKPKE